MHSSRQDVFNSPEPKAQDELLQLLAVWHSSVWANEMGVI